MDADTLTAKQATVELLRDRVLALRSDKPVRMLPERELAQRLSISRTNLRIALRVLREDGLIEQRQGSGTYVVPKVSVDHLHVAMSHDLKNDDPFYLAFLSELSKVLARNAVSIQFIDVESIAYRNETETPLLILGVSNSSVLDVVHNHYRSILSVQSYPNADFITQITFDDYKIGFVAAKQLLLTGCQQLVHLAGPSRILSSRLRHLGFLDSVSDAKIVVLEGRMNFSCGYDLGGAVVELSGKIGGRLGVFAANDWMALGLLRRLGEAHVAVPERVAVVGCDNIPLSAQNTPSLSTFNWDFNLAANEVLAQIKEMHGSPSYRNKKVLFTAPFVSRKSH